MMTMLVTALNLDHALGGGVALAAAALIVGVPIMFMVALAHAAGHPRPLPRVGLPGCCLVPGCVSTHHCGPDGHVNARGEVIR